MAKMIVWWDVSGLCLFAKRLDEDKFRWPRVENGVIRLAPPQLMAPVESPATAAATSQSIHDRRTYFRW